MKLDIAQFTHKGGREINEDSLFCGKDFFVVADGLGGHSAGETASTAAVNSFAENSRGGYTDERINELIEQANKAVLALKSDARTTAAAAFVENGIFRYINAGDSRIYYFRNNRVFAHSRDHSVCQMSVDMGLITYEEIRNHEDRSKLLKVLGDKECLNLKKAYAPIEIEDGDAFLLCSDGFWENVIEGEMEADLIKSGTAEEWLRFMLKRQLKRAHNEDDNYTAICGIFRGEEPVEATPQPAPKGKKSGVLAGVIGGIIILAAIAVLLIYGRAHKPPVTAEITTTSQTTAEITEETETTEEEAEITEDTEITEEQAEITVEATETTEESEELPTIGHSSIDMSSGRITVIKSD